MKNSVRWPSVIVCAAHPSSFPLPFAPLSGAQLFSPRRSRAPLFFPPLSFHPSAGSERERGREREGKRIQRWNVRWPYRFIALQSRAALPIAGKFKPCHRAGQFFLDELCLLGDRPRSRKSRPPPFSSIGAYCFRDHNVVSCSLRSPSAISFCFCSSRETGPIVNYRGTISFVLLSNRIELPACRSYLLIHSLYPVFSISHSYSNRTKERIEETLHTPWIKSFSSLQNLIIFNYIICISFTICISQ